MLRTFIQVVALGVTLVSSFFFIRGTVSLSAEDIAKLSRPGWSYNLDVAKNLIQNRADTKIGFYLVLFAFALQMINQLWPMRFNDFGVNNIGCILAIVASLILFFISLGISQMFQEKSYKQVEQILKKSKND